jgi:hypothetical protein
MLRQEKTLVERLVPHDTSKRDEGGRTALFLAVLSYMDASKTFDYSDARCQILNILLQNGDDSSIPDEVLCWTPFHLAVQTEAWYAASLLLQKYPAYRNHFLVRKNISNSYIEKVLTEATRCGFTELIQLMIECGVNVSFIMTDGLRKIMTDRIRKTTLLHNSASYITLPDMDTLDWQRFLLKMMHTLRHWKLCIVEHH